MKYLLLLTALAASLSAATVPLEWEPRPDDEAITEYRIYHLIGTNATLVATAPGSTNRVSFDMEPGKYVFVARSANFWGESINSNSASTPAKPQPPVIKTPLTTVTAITDANGIRFLVTVLER
jgi:hypothetical protein